jgi:lipid-A-disaccharide synthase
MSDSVMIVTGESSGELYGSLLARSLHRRLPGLRITGIGGERMKAAGVDLISGISGAFGLTEVVSSLGALRETFNRAVRALRTDRPAILVLIDYPDFNLRLAAEAKKNNIGVLYYVSPQVWAWRKRRVKKIAALADRMAAVLPFEEAIYRETGLETEFVGHPVRDEIEDLKSTGREEIKRSLGLEGGRPLLSLLPGSRHNEIGRLLPVVTAVVSEFGKEFGDFQFCVPFAPNTEMDRYAGEVEKLRRMGVAVNRGESLRTLAASELAVVASGTASLQAVFLGVPIVVIYKLFPLTYWLGKKIVRVKHISLVNILSGCEVVRELLQGDATAENIMGEIRRIIREDSYREGMLASFEKVNGMFAGKNASDRVAGIVMEMAGWEGLCAREQGESRV